MGMHEQNKKPQSATKLILVFGDAPWGLPPRVIHFWKALSRDNDIYVPGQKKQKADLILDESHRPTIVAFVDNKLPIFIRMYELY